MSTEKKDDEPLYIEDAPLPPVQAVRPMRPHVTLAADQPYNIFDTLRYYTGADRDLVWGPFYKRFRSNRRHKANWQDFNLDAIWKGIPPASQTRPGVVRRAINWARGMDPPPNITPPPPTMSKTGTAEEPKTPKTPVTPRRSGTWKDAGDDWSPARIDFEVWYGRLKHPADYNDVFFSANYKVLYERLCDFAETWFGAGTYLEDWRDSAKDKISVWEVPMTEQFIQYARLAAHEDSGYVGWSEMLNDPHHRKWLCVGIIAQIIEKRIFDNLLFGADPMTQAELDRHDSQWVHLEGFTRKEGRRQIVRAALGEGLVPEEFWDAVDDLAGQTVLIFQPLFTLMCLATGRTANRDGATFWQEIHTILALAGYFQVCMSVSTSIFHVVSASPGARYEHDGESHADNELYKASQAFHKSHEARWRVLAGLSAQKQTESLRKLMDSIKDPNDVARYMPFPFNEEELHVMDHQRRRGGKVMYAVFPKLTRYKAENVGEPIPVVSSAPEEILREGEGMRIKILGPSKVVYYQGLVHEPMSITDDGISLETHIRDIELSRLLVDSLPLWRRCWTADGKPTSRLHWPLWPESIDKFWLFWLLSLVASTILRPLIGEPESHALGIAYDILLLKPPRWLYTEALAYLALRLFGMQGFEGGPGMYLRIQGLNTIVCLIIEAIIFLSSRRVRFFSYFCSPFVWLDYILFDALPALIVVWFKAIRDETTRDFVKYAENSLGGVIRAAAAS